MFTKVNSLLLPQFLSLMEAIPDVLFIVLKPYEVLKVNFCFHGNYPAVPEFQMTYCMLTPGGTCSKKQVS